MRCGNTGRPHQLPLDLHSEVLIPLADCECPSMHSSHEGMHERWWRRRGEVVSFLFAESQRGTEGNFTDLLREGFDLLIVSSVFRIQNWN